MGSVISHFFQTGGSLLVSGNHRSVSEQTKKNVGIIFDALRANPKITAQRLEGLLTQIPKYENILSIHNEAGYNLLQKCVGINNIGLVRWLLNRNTDVNRGVCSLPLHIACLRGYEDLVELLLKHGARSDVECRMCWPGPHSYNCEQRSKYGCSDEPKGNRSSDKLQSAIYYAIDGDQVDILELLMQQGEDHWLPWQQKGLLLHIACERGAWNCVRYLVSERSEEINQCYDEYYPIHQAALHDIKFLELLIQCGATTTVRTATQQMTLLHVVFLLGRKSAEDTLQMCRLLMEHGLHDLINEPDSLGNTPLHALIVRHALEESRYGYDHDLQPWNKWDMLHIMRYLIQNGASPSINQKGNSALACVLRHIRDWEFRYELLDMLLQNGGDPNVVGRDGSVPMMVCLVPLINKDPLHHLTPTMKAFYLNCVRILCKHGANPNCASRSNLTPLHVLMFAATETISLNHNEKKAQAFYFIGQLLIILLQHGLDANIRFSLRNIHIFLSIMDMVQAARSPIDLDHIYHLMLTLLQYGANPNIDFPNTEPMICQSQSSVFLKKSSNYVLQLFIQLLIRKEELLADTDQHYVSIIHLFYMSMNHQQLYSCLRMLYRQISHTPGRHQLAIVIRELLAGPRTLKQLCRIVIYRALKGRTAQNVTKISVLPKHLQEYILNLEP